MDGKREATYKVTSEGFSGWAQIFLIKRGERYKLMRECNFIYTEEKDKKGKVSMKMNLNSDNMLAMEKLEELAPPFIKAVEIKNEKSGTIAKSWEDVQYDNDFDAVATEVCFALINGVSLGGK